MGLSRLVTTRSGPDRSQLPFRDLLVGLAHVPRLSTDPSALTNTVVGSPATR